MVKILEEDNYLMLEVFLLFLLVNFNPDVSNIYMWMSVIGFMGYRIARDKGLFHIIPYSRPQNFTKNLFLGIAAYAIFIYTIPVLFQIFSIAGFETQSSVLQVISETFTATPVLQNSKIMSLVVWGYLIARVETQAFFRTFAQWVAHKLKLNTSNLAGADMIKLYVIVMFTFVVFHITAKGITDNPKLIVTAWFALISTVMVYKFKEVQPAVMFHVTNNTLSVARQLDLLN